MGTYTDLRLATGYITDFSPLTLLHSERPKLHTILAFLTAIGLNLKVQKQTANFPSANFQTKFLTELYHIQNLKIRQHILSIYTVSNFTGSVVD